jgi:putative transposase
MTELCARFGISRRVGYKWLARYDAEGKAGLHDRSRAPHHRPHRIDDAVAELLVTTRRKHRAWGPEKLLDYLRPRYPRIDWPAVSTVGDLLKRRGLVTPRRRRYKAAHPGWARPRLTRLTTCGRPTSRVSSRPATGSTATR